MVIDKKLLIAERDAKQAQVNEMIGVLKCLDALIEYADKPEPKPEEPKAVPEAKPEADKKGK